MVPIVIALCECMDSCFLILLSCLFNTRDSRLNTDPGLCDDSFGIQLINSHVAQFGRDPR